MATVQTLQRRYVRHVLAEKWGYRNLSENRSVLRLLRVIRYSNILLFSTVTKPNSRFSIAYEVICTALSWKHITRAQQLLRWVTVPIKSKVGREVGAAVPLSVGWAGSPCDTTSPGSRPISVPSVILIHPTVWPQHTNVTDRQTGQTDNCPIA